MKKKEQKRLERIKEVMRDEREIEDLSLKELQMMYALMFEAIERMNAHRMMPASSEIH